jgi:hypothetical protein
VYNFLVWRDMIGVGGEKAGHRQDVAHGSLGKELGGEHPDDPCELRALRAHRDALL